MEKRIASLEIKQKNRTNIYNAVKENGELSKHDLVSILNLSLPTVTQNLTELIAEGLVQESGSVHNTGGRNAKSFSIVSDARVAIGIDITKHHVTTVIIDLYGRIIRHIRKKIEFEQSDDYFRMLGDTVESIIIDSNIKKEKILGVGFGVPGLITTDNQTVFYGEVLHFTDMTCAEFSKYINFPSALYNDAKASGFAEAWANPDLENAFYIMLSHTVGGAIYIKNSQYTGENIRAGEVGHIMIVPNGKQCYCGQKGCVDPYCCSSVLTSITNGSLPDFFAELESQNLQALSIWDEYLGNLAKTVTDLRMLFDCSVIIGGNVGAYIDNYLDDLKSRIAGKSSFESNADYILPCKIKNEAIATGAALHFIEDFLKTI